jgi:dUTP pyrophosphatase
MKIKVKKMCPDIPIISKGYPSDAGWDLHANEDVTILAGERSLIDTGLQLEIPNGYAGLIWPRSGMAVKNGIDVLAGVVDSGYRGVVKVCLYNSGKEDFKVSRYDRIAQILFQSLPVLLGIEEVDEINNSCREAGGFGSTGK